MIDLRAEMAIRLLAASLDGPLNRARAHWPLLRDHERAVYERMADFALATVHTAIATRLEYEREGLRLLIARAAGQRATLHDLLYKGLPVMAKKPKPSSAPKGGKKGGKKGR